MLKRITILAIAIALTMTSFAQEYEQLNAPAVKAGVTPDSAYKHKLNSSYFNDSLNRIRLFAWNINTYTNIPARVKLDTGQRNVQRGYPFYKDGHVGAVYLGNVGGAAIDFDFFKVKPQTPFFFQNVYQHFVGTPENIKFYNTKVPYSNVRYATAGNKTTAEELFGLTIAQNINPALSVGINYDRWGTKGLYKNQRSKNKDFSGYLSYLGTHYTAYLGYIYNIADVQENGGLANEKNVLDTTMKPEFMNVRLRKAGNLVKSNTFFLSQTYSIPLSDNSNFEKDGIYDGPALLAGLYTKYSTYERVYTDDTTGIRSWGNKFYYKNFYIDPAKSYDSTRLREIDNRAYIQLHPYTNNSLLNLIGGGIGYQHLKYYMFNLNNYLFGASSTKHYNVYTYAFASGKFRKYIDWSGLGKLVLAGYNAGDISANGKVAFSAYPWGREVKLEGDVSFNTITPDFYMQNYFSNHFAWSNSFSRTIDTRLEAKLTIPYIDMEIGARQAIINDYLYFDSAALPQQASGVVSVTSAYVQKDLALGNFHIDGQVLFQKSSREEVLPLPKITANVGVYLQFNVVKNVLSSQVGVDVNYNTAYYMYDYNPAVGQFHLQTNRKVGNYPWLDAFANFKWKRAALFVKVRNVGKDFVGGYDYFSAYGYPRVPLQFQYGVSWSFYD